MKSASRAYRERHHRFVSAVRVGALLWLIFVAYQLTGTFSFANPQPGGWAAFLQLPVGGGRTRDWIENVLLMLPAGSLIALYCTLTDASIGCTLLSVLLPVGTVALCMEGLQWWMPERTASVWDAACMMVGGGLGSVLGRPLGLYFRTTDRPRWSGGRSGGYWVAYLWVAAAWVPTHLRLHANLLASSIPAWPGAGEVTVSWTDLVWTTACWLVCLRLIEPHRPVMRLTSLLGLAWVGLVLAPGRILSWEAVLGGSLALGVAASRHFWRSPPRYTWLAVVIMAIVVKALGYAPPTTYMGAHGDLPLGFGSLSGAVLPAISLLIEDYFLVIAAPWLITRRFPSPAGSIRSIAAAGGGLLLLEIAKARDSGGHFQVTGLVLFALSTFAAYRWPVPLRRPGAPTPDPHVRGWVLPGSDRDRRMTNRPKRTGLLSTVGGFIAICLVLGALLRLPQVPYNVRDLFVTRNVAVGLLLFTAFLLWSTGAPVLVARFLVTRPVLHLAQPLFFLVMAVPSWFLLRYAVSAESLGDILGAPVLGWPSDWEFFVRYLAFSAPFLLWLMYWDLLFEGATSHSQLVGAVHLMVALLLGMPLLWVAKLGVIDFAATDNIVELIADVRGTHAIVALWLLIGVVTLNGVVVGWSLAGSRTRWVTVVVVTPLLVASSGWLLHVGMTPPAIQFLIGRSHASSLIPREIAARWIAVHLAGACVIAWAQTVARRIPLPGIAGTKVLDVIPGR